MGQLGLGEWACGLERIHPSQNSSQPTKMEMFLSSSDPIIKTSSIGLKPCELDPDSVINFQNH